MWVFAVTHVLRFDELAVESTRECVTLINAQYFRSLVNGAQVVSNHAVISSSVLERFQRQVETQFSRQTLVCIDFLQNLIVIRGVYHDTNVRVVFRG